MNSQFPSTVSLLQREKGKAKEWLSKAGQTYFREEEEGLYMSDEERDILLIHQPADISGWLIQLKVNTNWTKHYKPQLGSFGLIGVKSSCSIWTPCMQEMFPCWEEENQRWIDSTKEVTVRVHHHLLVCLSVSRMKPNLVEGSTAPYHMNPGGGQQRNLQVVIVLAVCETAFRSTEPSQNWQLEDATLSSAKQNIRQQTESLTYLLL